MQREKKKKKKSQPQLLHRFVNLGERENTPVGYPSLHVLISFWPRNAHKLRCTLFVLLYFHSYTNNRKTQAHLHTNFHPHSHVSRELDSIWHFAWDVYFIIFMVKHLIFTSSARDEAVVFRKIFVISNVHVYKSNLIFSSNII